MTMADSMYPTINVAKDLIAELCKLFYSQGWVSGTGGGISIRCTDSKIAMAPSGVQKERMRAEDMFLLDLKGKIVETPTARPLPYKAPKLSECSPLFMLAYELRDAGGVMHSHSTNAVLATLLDPAASEFRCTHLEMMKGIAGHGFYDTLTIPIIENTARECELTDRMHAAMLKYPKASAVLVRRHGVYVWGSTWIEAKTQAECYDYLFGAAVQMANMGICAGLPPAALPMHGKRKNGENGHSTGEPLSKRSRTMVSKQPKCIVLDIEGTVAPISFVTETLFPYAKANVKSFLEATFEERATQAAISILRTEAAEEKSSGADGHPIKSAEEGKQAVVESCVKNVEAQMAEDRKTTALKFLQGLIWTGGYQKGDIKGKLFQDVPGALQMFRNLGIKTYIYSSGSRLAQRDLFRHTQVGDMRPYLMGFFDTKVGSKRDSTSYREIAVSLAVDSPDDIMFATDIVEEADAAQAAGWQVTLVSRPGNKELPSDHKYTVIDTMDKLLGVYQ